MFLVEQYPLAVISVATFLVLFFPHPPKLERYGGNTIYQIEKKDSVFGIRN